MKPKPASIENVISEARAAGMTQSDLAIAAGFPPSQLSAWKNGARPPNLRNLRRLYQAVQMDVLVIAVPSGGSEGEDDE